MTALQSPRGVAVNVNAKARSRPDRSPALQVIVDRKPLPACLLFPGNTSLLLIGPSSESPARRLQIIDGLAQPRVAFAVHSDRPGARPAAIRREHAGHGPVARLDPRARYLGAIGNSRDRRVVWASVRHPDFVVPMHIAPGDPMSVISLILEHDLTNWCRESPPTDPGR